MHAAPLDLAMSTSWNIQRSTNLADMLDGIRGLGFTRIELNALGLAWTSELAEALSHWGMTVQSVHVPCPYPVDAAGQRLNGPHMDGLASLDPVVRSQSLAWARATVDLVRTISAQAAVIHLGHVDIASQQGAPFALLRENKLEEFSALRAQVLAEREARKGPHLRAALSSIRELGAYAAEAGVALGAEIRDCYHEIPLLAEFDEILNAAESFPVYYWHDVGHAEKHRLLGLASQKEYLRRFGGRLLGVHLHDSILNRDHCAPGCGEVNKAPTALAWPYAQLPRRAICSRRRRRRCLRS